MAWKFCMADTIQGITAASSEQGKGFKPATIGRLLERKALEEVR
jgi:hypothetical protein